MGVPISPAEAQQQHNLATSAETLENKATAAAPAAPPKQADDMSRQQAEMEEELDQCCACCDPCCACAACGCCLGGVSLMPTESCYNCVESVGDPCLTWCCLMPCLGLCGGGWPAST